VCALCDHTPLPSHFEPILLPYLEIYEIAIPHQQYIAIYPSSALEYIYCKKAGGCGIPNHTHAAATKAIMYQHH
jgi:hypothetical protein